MIFTEAELVQLGHPTQEVKDWLAANPRPPPTDPPDIMASRAAMKAYDDLVVQICGSPPADIEEFDKEVTMRDGTVSPITIQRPATQPKGGSPLFVLIFGGGFVAGSRHQSKFRARTLVKLFGAVCVSITYRLAPEHKFPIMQQDGWDNLKWISDNAKSLGASPETGFVVVGSSAGASIAAVLARRSVVEEPLSHKITGEWLDIPVIFGDINSIPEQYRKYWLSRDQMSHPPDGFLRSADVHAFAEAMQWNPTSTWCTPAAYPNSYKDMPRTYLAVGGADPLRDDGLIYEEMLKQDGAATKIDVYPGCPHGHAAFMRGTAIGDKGAVDGFIGAGWLLGKDVSVSEVAAAFPVPAGQK